MGGGHWRPGKIGLYPKIIEHIDLVEADLLEVYGVDILDWYRGVISTRRVLNLVYQLREGSAFIAVIRDQPRHTFADQRLMDIPEALTGKAHPIRKQLSDLKKKQTMAPHIARARAARARRQAKFNTT